MFKCHTHTNVPMLNAKTMLLLPTKYYYSWSHPGLYYKLYHKSNSSTRRPYPKSFSPCIYIYIYICRSLIIFAFLPFFTSLTLIYNYRKVYTSNFYSIFFTRYLLRYLQLFIHMKLGQHNFK